MVNNNTLLRRAPALGVIFIMLLAGAETGLDSCLHIVPNTCMPQTTASSKTEGVASASACCQLCSADAACAAWTFHSNRGGRCVFHPKGAPTKPGNCTSGTKDPAPSPPPSPSPSPTPPTPPTPSPDPRARPNFVYVLCDDMDVVLGTEAVIPQTRALVAEAGARFSNAFVSSPKCTPSRSAWLSGRHYHNLRPGGASTGRGLNTSSFFDRDALFPTLRRAGYATGLFGKIHNDQHGWLCTAHNRTFPFSTIGTECSPCGGYYRLGSNDWVEKDDDDDVPRLVTLSPDDPRSTYSHAQYGNRSQAFIRNAVAARRNFFAYIGTSGPHLGVVPAPWHRSATEENVWNVSAPRTPNFNVRATTHNAFMRTRPALDDAAIEHVDRHMRDRWGAMLSIDDVVAGVVATLEEEGVLNNTYVLFSSDHGYHLGQFRIPDEKMLPYESDIRIPLYVRGPRVSAGQVLPELVANIDVAPTVLDLAGLPVPTLMDGHSLVPLLTGGAAQAGRQWRTAFVSEFAEGNVQKWGGNGMWMGARLKLSEFMPGVGATGTPDRYHPAGALSTENATACQAMCEAAGASCFAWTNAVRKNQGDWGCSLYTNVSSLGPQPPVVVANGSAYPMTTGLKDPSAYKLNPDGWFDGKVDPPAAPASNASDLYTYDDPSNQWRLLRVLNETHDFTYVQFDPDFFFNATSIAFHEFFDMKTDPWQQHNVWESLGTETRQALMEQLAGHASCHGTRTTASNCP